MTWSCRLVVGLGTVAALWAGARPASAQSLADIARQEEARRKATTASVKVYTNDSLVRIPGETIPTPPGPALAGANAATEPSAKPALAAAGIASAAPVPDPTKTPEYWRKRMADAREQRDRNRVYLDALQSRINGLWTDFTARDDPAQRAVIATERQRAINEQDRLTAEQKELEELITSIEEDARRAGVPPGWLR